MSSAIMSHGLHVRECRLHFGYLCDAVIRVFASYARTSTVRSMPGQCEGMELYH